MSLTPNPKYLEASRVQKIGGIGALSGSMQPFEECFCGISQMIGYSSKMLSTFKSVKTVWDKKVRVQKEVEAKRSSVESELKEAI